jgi:hypothetical protein
VKDERVNIAVFLETKEKGKSAWEHWIGRPASVWDKKFVPDRRTKEKAFRKEFPTLQASQQSLR